MDDKAAAVAVWVGGWRHAIVVAAIGWVAMITMGSPDVDVMDDGWTIRTADGSMSAHFEHTVAITADGPRILTPRVGVPGGVNV